MAEAHSRMHLRDNVTDIDVSVAISVMLDSFIQSQKVSVARNLKKKFSHFITFREDSRGLLMSIIDRLYKERVHSISLT
jgi:DNA replication licensing factor MCM2